MRRWNKRSLPLCTDLPTLRVLLVAILAVTGCVTRGTYKEVEGSRDAALAESKQLRKELELTRASNKSLSTERVQLIDEIEDLRQARAALSDGVATLEMERDRLAADLDRRVAELEAGRAEVGQLRSTYDDLVSDLQGQVAEGRVEIQRLREGLLVNLAQEVLFPVGSALLDPGGRDILATVAARLRELPYRIQVQGHTDDTPIRGSLAQLYPSNWELAAARAASVVRLLIEEGVAPERLEAVSFGSARPRDTNETPEGRARNRRIELRLSSEPTGADRGEAATL